MKADGVGFQYHCAYEKVDTDPVTGVMTLHYRQGVEYRRLEVDGLLVAVGRKPNVDGLDLEAAGVEFDPREGVKVNDELRTSNPNVFAVGDVARNLIAMYKALGGGWELRTGKAFVPAETTDQMRQRTDWGELLEPGATEVPPPADAADTLRSPDW